jgi:hypothetical protein
MADNDDHKRDTDHTPQGKPTTEPGAEAPKRSVQDILAGYQASRNAPQDADGGVEVDADGSSDADDLADEDEQPGEDAEADDVPGSSAGRRAALRSAGIQSSLLDIEEQHQRAMHEAVKFRPSSKDEDDEEP